MENIQTIIIGVVVALVAIILLATMIKIVPQGNAYVVERLGKYKATWQAGMHLKLPLVDKIVRRISLKEQVADFEENTMICSDNSSISLDSVVFFCVQDPKMMTYGIERPIAAIENLCATTLRNIVGTMTLDETLTSRDKINSQITAILDEATDKWGIKVTRVEVKNITPPKSIQEAMEKQMKAERERREAILRAEGEKQAAITRAEGEKESAILRAEAVREERTRIAQGEAEAIKKVAEAKAKAIKLINEAKPSKEYLAIRSMEASEKMADGKATKLIVPSELQNLTSFGAVLKESTKLEEDDSIGFLDLDKGVSK